jgi:hypothetical protein
MRRVAFIQYHLYIFAYIIISYSLTVVSFRICNRLDRLTTRNVKLFNSPKLEHSIDNNRKRDNIRNFCIIAHIGIYCLFSVILSFETF